MAVRKEWKRERNELGARRPKAREHGGMHRLLYIEDNPVNVVIVEELLTTRPDIELRVARTGALGLQLAADWQPALVLLDERLPDAQGSALLPQLRLLLPQARVVSLSAGDGELPGFDACWRKPLDFGVFHACLRAWLPPS
jgi:CheY-like chemotaxis protein